MKRGTIVFIAVALILAVAAAYAGNLFGGSKPEGVLYILPEKGVDHVEFTTSKKLLEDNGIKVTLASTKIGEITDDRNETYRSTILIKDAKVEDYRLIAVMGGNGMKLIEDNEDVMKLLQNANAKEKYIGAICYGPVLLARAGILSGIEATVYQSEKNKKILSDNGAVVKADELVLSGNILTAAGPETSRAFGEKLVELLK